MSDRVLADRRILVVEDNYMLARDLTDFLESRGATIVGPVGRLDAGVELARREQIDAAVLDVNLRDELVYPVADVLIAQGVPIVFCTGYEELVLRRPYVGLPRCPKPVDKPALVDLLVRILAPRRSA